MPSFILLVQNAHHAEAEKVSESPRCYNFLKEVKQKVPDFPETWGSWDLRNWYSDLGVAGTSPVLLKPALRHLVTRFPWIQLPNAQTQAAGAL